VADETAEGDVEANNDSSLLGGPSGRDASEEADLLDLGGPSVQASGSAARGSTGGGAHSAPISRVSTPGGGGTPAGGGSAANLLDLDGLLGGGRPASSGGAGPRPPPPAAAAPLTLSPQARSVYW
jgi:hypothetical protein